MAALGNGRGLPNEKYQRECVMKKLEQFHEDEDGAVTVDWVVLTASIIGLSLACIGVFANGTGNAGQAVDSGLTYVSSNMVNGDFHDW